MFIGDLHRFDFWQHRRRRQREALKLSQSTFSPTFKDFPVTNGNAE
jgi:hypothetical protein